MIRAVLALLVLASGCATGRVYELGAEWAPLERVAETRDPTIPTDMIVTVEHTAYVRDLAAFLRENPPGSPTQTALLAHERVHAVRELARGWEWFALYNTVPSFRWSEEQAGWAEEIRTIRAGGARVDSESMARFLSSRYPTIFGVPMVSYEDALAWVKKKTAEQE